jgi:hypothetical protein
LSAIQLVEVRDGAIARIDHFMQPELSHVFGLAEQIERDPAQLGADGRPCIDLAAEALRRLEH